jgi:hypothetical protein
VGLAAEQHGSAEADIGRTGSVAAFAVLVDGFSQGAFYQYGGIVHRTDLHQF